MSLIIIQWNDKTVVGEENCMVTMLLHNQREKHLEKKSSSYYITHTLLDDSSEAIDESIYSSYKKSPYGGILNPNFSLDSIYMNVYIFLCFMINGTIKSFKWNIGCHDILVQL